MDCRDNLPDPGRRQMQIVAGVCAAESLTHDLKTGVPPGQKGLQKAIGEPFLGANTVQFLEF